MPAGAGRADAALFEPAAFAFFEQLAANNTREWFTAHRADYEGLVREPLEVLCEVAQAKYGTAKVFRPNRDVRFSADKSPYKTNGAMWSGGVGGVYVSVSAEGIVAGGGIYEPSRGQLQRAREAIDDERTGEELVRIVDALTRGGFELAGPPLKTAPRGYDREHPRIDLLRLTHYAALKPLDRDASVDDVQAVWKEIDPLREWAARHAGPADERPYTR